MSTARRELRGTDIYVNEDVPTETQKERRALMPIFKAAQMQKLKTFFSGSKLVIDGQSYTRSSLDRLPPELSPRSICEKDIGQYKFFGGSLSPFSNFYQHNITVEGKDFNCTEQYYQYKWAKYAEDESIAKQILSTPDPAVMKALARKVKTHKTKDWLLNSARAIMQRGLMEKFGKDEKLKAMLQEAGTMTIAECNKYDTTWAIGLDIRDHCLNDVTEWKGKNWMGELLMEVRDLI
jgi:ribA/ribD-fused uncharacterized protein